MLYHSMYMYIETAKLDRKQVSVSLRLGMGVVVYYKLA